MGVIQKAEDVRYFTFYLQFPNGETKWHQVPFIHDLMFDLQKVSRRLKSLGLEDHAGFAREILVKGEYKWTDRLKNKWLVRVENKPRPDNWL